MIARSLASLSFMVLLTAAALPAQVTDFRPVTEETLRNPAPGDWLNWRRTDNAWGDSPLDEINRENVGQLQLAWSWAMDESGAQEATPLVYDGIMYLPNPRDVIQALDAATGDLIWEYRPEIDPDGAGGLGPQKSIAIYGDKIFGATLGAHIVALDARTGQVVWDTQTADPSLGYRYTAGPIVVRGTVIAGITGCDRYKEDVCFIVGLDADTGEEKWRTATVALPGEPGGDTWGDLPLEFRAGSDTWISSSYDPEANLVYYGTSQAKPWARAVRGTWPTSALVSWESRGSWAHPFPPPWAPPWGASSKATTGWRFHSLATAPATKGPFTSRSTWPPSGSCRLSSCVKIIITRWVRRSAQLRQPRPSRNAPSVMI